MEKNIVLNTEQSAALKMVIEEKRNVFISGAGGTGKSTIIEEIKKHFENVIVTAPTGRAALEIKGQTLHSVFKLPVRPLLECEELQVPETVLAADVIIIDEISMVRSDYFNGITRIIIEAAEKASNPKIIVVIGDFFQLPPVITPSDRRVLTNAWPEEDCNDPCFMTKAWAKCNFVNIGLRENVRSLDPEHSANLNKMRVGDSDCVDFYNSNTSKSKLDAISLCARKIDAEQINNDHIKRLSTKELLAKAISKGEFPEGKRMVPSSITLKEEMRVMAVCNSPVGYKNGSLGTIRKISSAGVEVAFDAGFTSIVAPFTWEEKRLTVVNDTLKETTIGWYSQIPLIPAYAITIHRAQGATLEAINIYTDVFQNGMLYVAFSRCRTASNIWIDKPLRRSDLSVSIQVKEFYVNSGMLDE